MARFGGQDCLRGCRVSDETAGRAFRGISVAFAPPMPQGPHIPGKWIGTGVRPCGLHGRRKFLGFAYLPAIGTGGDARVTFHANGSLALDRFSKRVALLRNVSLTVPVGPLRCLAMMISAMLSGWKSGSLMR